MKSQWERFGSGFETFSLWISEKEKQLDLQKSSMLTLDEQMSTVKVKCNYLTSVSGICYFNDELIH